MGFWSIMGKTAAYTAAAVGQAAITGVVGAANTVSKVSQEYKKPESQRNVASCVFSGLAETIGNATLDGVKVIGEGAVDIYDDYQRGEEIRKNKEKEMERRYELMRLSVPGISPGSFNQYDFQVMLAGASMENRVEYIKNVKINERLVAVREKENEHDYNAIALYSGINKIGYIPADTAAKIAPKIDNNKGMAVEVVSVSQLDTPYPKVVLKIIMDSDYRKVQKTYSRPYYDEERLRVEDRLREEGVYSLDNYDYTEIEVDDDVRDYQLSREYDF